MFSSPPPHPPPHLRACSCNTTQQTLFWVLGEYGNLSTTMPLADITSKLCALADKTGSENATRGFAVAAVLKLTAQLGSLLPCVAQLVQKYSQSRYDICICRG
jgi:hypothetical protein